MSHYGMYHVGITNASKEIVLATLRLMQKTANQEFQENTIAQSTYGDRRRAQFVIKNALETGDIGINVQRGEIQIEADTYRVQDRFAQFKARFEQHYKAVATFAAMQKLGYQVNLTQEEGQLRIVAEGA